MASQSNPAPFQTTGGGLSEGYTVMDVDPFPSVAEANLRNDDENADYLGAMSRVRASGDSGRNTKGSVKPGNPRR